MERLGVPEASLARVALEVRAAVALVEDGAATRVLVAGVSGAAAVVALLRGEALARGVIVEPAACDPAGILVRPAPRLVPPLSDPGGTARRRRPCGRARSSRP